jgi:hypothetical protein
MTKKQLATMSEMFPKPKRYYRVWDEYACQYGTHIIHADTASDAEEIFRRQFANPDNPFPIGQDYTAERVEVVEDK